MWFWEPSTQTLSLFGRESFYVKKKEYLAANTLYRLVKMVSEGKHHYFYGTIKDPENAYFHSLSVKLVFKILTGVFFIQNILLRKIRQVFNYTRYSDKVKLISLIRGITINLLIIFVCVKYNYWQYRASSD